MNWLRGICRFKFKISGDEINFEIGFVWIALIGLALWSVFA